MPCEGHAVNRPLLFAWQESSGVKVFIDLLRATHGPWNIPATNAERMILINCHVFIVGANSSPSTLWGQTVGVRFRTAGGTSGQLWRVGSG
jgi:hypothetical protein